MNAWAGIMGSCVSRFYFDSIVTEFLNFLENDFHEFLQFIIGVLVEKRIRRTQDRTV